MAWKIIELSEIENLRKKLILLLEKDFVTQTVDAKVKKLSKEVQLKGFRPGKVPAKVIQKKFGKSLEQEVVQEEMQKSFEEALKQENLHIAMHHEVKPIDEVEAGWHLEADFDVFPTFELADLSTIKVTVEGQDITDEMLKERKEQWQQFLGKYEVQERAAKKDDMVLMKVEVFDANQELLEKEREKTFIVGSPQLPEPVAKAIDAQLAGFKASVQIPAEGDEAETNWNLELVNVQERIVPDWDEEGIKQLGIEPATQEGLDQRVKETIENEQKEKQEHESNEQIVDALVQLHQLDLPNALIEREINTIAKQNAPADANPDEQADVPEDKKEEYKAQAIRQVRLSLVLGKISEEQSLKPDVAWMQQTLQQQASQYPDPQQFMQIMTSNEPYMRQLEAKALEISVLRWVADKATVDVKAASKQTQEKAKPKAKAASKKETKETETQEAETK